MKKAKQLLAVLISFALVLSLVSADLRIVKADTVDNYLANCTEYASYLTVKTKAVTNLMDYPCDSADNCAAKIESKVTKGTILNVTALYKNINDEYWYQIERLGKKLFVKATNVELISHKTGDVSAAGLVSPACLGYGKSFAIEGSITSDYNKISTVCAAMYSGVNTTKSPAISSSDTVNGKSYSLKGSTVDNNLLFGSLSGGNYTYLLTTDVISYYVDAKGNLKESTKTVTLENKICTVTNASSPNPITAKGIDVSTWQGDIDWAKTAEEIDFAILRASYSTTLDNKFIRNANGCRDNNIPFGVYVYSYATTAAQAKAEAEFIVSALKGYHLDFPVYFDFEDETQMSLSESTMEAIIKAFVEVVEDAGYQAGIYTYTWVWNSYLTEYYFSGFPKWIAQPDSSSCTFTGGVSMWQYSWVGKFSGISGDVDSNYFYGIMPGTDPDTSYLSKCTQYPSNLKVKTTQQTNMMKYPCTTSVNSSSTVVKSVAEATELQVTALYKNTTGEYWYQVETGASYGYILAGEALVTSYLYDDIAIENPAMAKNLSVGAGYPIEGTLHSRYNKMTSVNAKVFAGENTLGSSAIESSYAANTKEYRLNASEVDNKLIFSDLKEGYYTYEISVDVKNYYVNTSNELANQNKNIVIWSQPFTVGETSTTHSHTNVTDAAVSASCTATGLTAGTHCSTCNEITKEQTVVAKKAHTEGAAVKENEVAGVSYDSVVYCTVCKAEVSRKKVTVSTESDSKDNETTDKSDEGETTDKSDEGETTDKSDEGETTDKSDEGETTDKSDEGETTDKSDEGETTDKSDEGQTTDKSDEGQTTDKSDEGQTTDKSDEGETTDKSDEGETTDKSDEGETTDKSDEEETTDKKDEADEKIKLEESFLTSTIKDYTYTGRAITQSIKLLDGDKLLVNGVDYSVKYMNNINAGTATVVIVGKGIYEDSIVRQYKIARKAVKSPTVTLSKTKYVYTGSAFKPSVTVKNGNTKLTVNKDYKITYSNNIKPGKATVKVSFINNYSGSATKNFTITPAQVKGQKQSGFGTKNVTITWNKVASVSGYEIYRSSKKTGTYTKVKTIAGSTNKFTHNNLKSGTVYYYKIRAYKKSGSSYIYGAFSNVMSATTKPGAVTIKASAGTKRAVISWNKVNGAKGYEVYMSASKNGKYTKIAAKNASTTKVEKSRLTSKKIYYFKVRAYTKTATGKKVYAGYSNIKSVKVK